MNTGSNQAEWCNNLSRLKLKHLYIVGLMIRLMIIFHKLERFISNEINRFKYLLDIIIDNIDGNQ